MTEDERILAMHMIREGLKKIWRDGYQKQVDLRIDLVRKVMKQMKLASGDAACFIARRANDKNDAFLWAAALEIVDEDTRVAELN